MHGMSMLRALASGILIAWANLSIAQSIPQDIDSQLVGTWRNTSGHSSGSFSITTDTFYTLRSDGTFIHRSHTVGSGGETRSGPEYGAWRAGNGRIFIQFQGDPEISSTAYTVSGRSLVLPEETKDLRYWERIR